MADAAPAFDPQAIVWQACEALRVVGEREGLSVSGYVQDNGLGDQAVLVSFEVWRSREPPHPYLCKAPYRHQVWIDQSNEDLFRQAFQLEAWAAGVVAEAADDIHTQMAFELDW